MILIRQDKKGIVNLDRMDIICVVEYGKRNFIEINYENAEHKLIAEYESEERVKEVLQEIIQKYSSYLKLEGGPAILQGQIDIQPNIFNIPKVFVMPTE